MSFLLAGTTIERDIGLNPYPELTLLSLFVYVLYHIQPIHS